MAFSKTGLVAVSLAALLAAGCSSTRFSSMNDAARAAAARAGRHGDVVEHAAAAGRARDRGTDPANFPTAPGRVDATSLPPADPAADRARHHHGQRRRRLERLGVRPELQVGDPADQVRRELPRRPAALPAPVDGVKSWNVAGKQLSLYDESGSVVARLYSSGAGKIRWTDLDRIAYLAYPVDRSILLSSSDRCICVTASRRIRPSRSATRISSTPARSRDDPAQEPIVAALDRLIDEISAKRLAAQVERARLAVRQAARAPSAGEGALHPWRRRPRQDHADGPVLRGCRRCGASGACISTPSWPTCTTASSSIGRRARTATVEGRRSDPAGRRGARRRGLGALLRRVLGHRHRRRDDPVAAVLGAVRRRRRAGRDLQRRARRPLPATGSTARFSCPSSACCKRTCRGDARSTRAPTTGWRSSPHAGLS